MSDSNPAEAMKNESTNINPQLTQVEEEKMNFSLHFEEIKTIQKKLNGQDLDYNTINWPIFFCPFN